MYMSSLARYSDENFTLSHALTEKPDQSQFRLHTHAQAEIYYFVRGAGVFHIEGSAYPLEPGDLLIMQPAESHYIEVDLNQPYERKMIHFDVSVLQKIDPTGALLAPILNRQPGKDNLYKPFLFSGGSEHYFNIMFNRDVDPRISITVGLLSLLHELCALKNKSAQEQVETTDSVEYQILRYLNQDITRTITLQDICQKFYISRTQLYRLFRGATGVSVKKYITVKRLVYARQRIEAGEPASQVYLQCGFNDYSCFYRAYLKYYGHPPTRSRTPTGCDCLHESDNRP